LIEELNLKGDETILDLGCGNGLTTKELAGKVPNGKVVGIDNSISMIETAKSHKTENMKKLFIDSVIERMIKKTKQPNGTCFETFRRINVCARK